MIESIVAGISVLTSIGIGALVWYRIGKIEEKVDVIYNHIDIAIRWRDFKCK